MGFVFPHLVNQDVATQRQYASCGHCSVLYQFISNADSVPQGNSFLFLLHLIFLLLPACSWEYYVDDAPRIVLDKLERYGYHVVSMTGVGQTLVWCLHKE